MSEDTTFLFSLALLAGVYFAFMVFVEWLKSLFGVSSSGGGSRGDPNRIVNAYQRGDKIEIVKASGHTTIMSGYLQGWSQDSVSFRDGDTTGSYDKNGSYTYYH